jgi:hypothetical protein
VSLETCLLSSLYSGIWRFNLTSINFCWLFLTISAHLLAQLWVIFEFVHTSWVWSPGCAKVFTNYIVDKIFHRTFVYNIIPIRLHGDNNVRRMAYSLLKGVIIKSKNSIYFILFLHLKIFQCMLHFWISRQF